MRAICNDMRHICLEKQFDCVIAWHSFFHLYQEDQREMFKVFKQHIKPGGLLVFTSGTSESEIWSDNGGEMLYHASLSENEYQSLLDKYHFKVMLHKTEDPDCGDATVWVAKYNEKIYALKQIETPRLIIRPVQLGDEVAINKAVNNSLKPLQKWQPWAKDPSIDATREFVQRGVLRIFQWL